MMRFNRRPEKICPNNSDAASAATPDAISDNTSDAAIGQFPMHCIGPNGFTLMEILVAVLIFGTIMLTIFSSFKSFVVSNQMIQGHISRSEKGDLMLHRIAKDLQSIRIALPPEYRSSAEGASASSSNSGWNTGGSEPLDELTDPFRIVGDEIVVNGTSFSTLTFASFSHISFGDDKRTGVARITYYPRENSHGGIDLCRSDTLSLTVEDASIRSACDPVLCRDITEFKLIYHHRNGDEYEEWDSDSESFDYTTPVAVSISISFNIKSGVGGMGFGGTGATGGSYDSQNETGTGGSVANQYGDDEDGNRSLKRVETQIRLPLFRKADKE